VVRGKHKLPLPADVAEAAGQYGVNYAALCQELDRLLQLFQPTENEDRLDRLIHLADYLCSHVRVLRVVAPDAAAARLAFRIANTPGEPLDTPTVMRQELAATLDAGDESDVGAIDELHAQFDVATPGLDFGEDERAILATARAYLCRVCVQSAAGGPDELIRQVLTAAAQPGHLQAESAAAFFTSALPRHADLIKLHVSRQRDNPKAPLFRLRSAVRTLFALEAAGARTARESGDVTVREESLLWRPVAMQLLRVLSVRNLNSPEGSATAAHELAADALLQLERVLLYHALVKTHGQLSQLHARLDSMLRDLAVYARPAPGTPGGPAAPHGVANLSAKLLLTDAEQRALWDALDGELYKPTHPLVTTALRHLLVRLNALWYAENVKDGQPMQAANDLVFAQDWTTEHIFSQTPSAEETEGSEAPQYALMRKFFKPDDGRPCPLNMLGNLAPLDTTLQPVARNHPFAAKQNAYRNSNNFLMRAVGHVDTFAAGAVFSSAQFRWRHATLKQLLAKRLFCFSCDAVPEQLLPLPSKPTDDDAGEGAPGAAPPDSQDRAGAAETANALLLQLCDKLNNRARPDIKELLPRSKDRITETAFQAALNTVANAEERGRVAKLVAKLFSEAQQTDEGCRLFFFLAEATEVSYPATKYKYRTRRLMLVHYFQLGFLAPADFELPEEQRGEKRPRE
jgi:hypothetical protein